MFYLKKIIIFILIVSLVFPFGLNQTEAASTTLSKTVEFFAGQDGNIRTDGSQFPLIFSNVLIPETAPLIKSATIEISGVSYNDSGNQTINVDLEYNSNPAELGTTYILAQNTKPKIFNIKYDALSKVSTAVSSYTLYLRGAAEAGNYSFSIFSAKLVITYQYSATSAELLKTNKFFILQEIGNKADGAEASADFTVTIPEQSPAIQSVFIEANGIAKSTGAGIGTASVSVTDQGGTNYANYSLDLGGAGNITKFLVRYDASAAILSADFPGSKTYTLRLKGAGFSVNLWNAKVIVTYKYSENTGGLPVSGYVISSTIDTGAVKGAAYNSIMWQGNLNGGKVRLQLATSNCAGGQSDYPACSTGAWGDANTPYMGYDEGSGNCSPSYFYDISDPLGPSKEIMCTNIHNNKRYFRYKIILCSDDCIAAGNNNPEVTDVVVNWAE